MRHNYKNHYKEYNNVFCLFVNYVLGSWKIWVILYDLFDSCFQSIFNRKSLVTRSRFELLKFMLLSDLQERSVDPIYSNKPKSFDPVSLMREFHGIRVLLHPNKEFKQKELELYLKSLAESGELKEDSGQYSIQPKALITLEEVEKSDRKHNEILRVQVVMAVFTILIGIFTALNYIHR